MRAIFRKYSSCLVLLALSQLTFAQSPNFVNEFLNIGVGARAHGMFGSVVADVNDVTAAFWNPAGLSTIDEPFEVSAMHAEWFGSVANYDYISFGKQLDKEIGSYGAISIIRMAIDNIPNTLNLIGPDGSVDYDRVTSFSAADYGIFLSYGRNLKPAGMSLGGSIKVIRRSIGSFGGAWGFGADVGWMWKRDKLSIGVMAKDITTTFNTWSFDLTEEEKIIFQQTGNDIPVSSTEINLPKLLIGASYKIAKEKLSYTINGQLNISSNGTKAGVLSSEKINLDPTFGFEIGFVNKVYVRAGVGNIQNVINPANSNASSLEFQPNIGLGLNLGRINVDYALGNLAEVAGIPSSHIISLRLRFEDRNSSSL